VNGCRFLGEIGGEPGADGLAWSPRGRYLALLGGDNPVIRSWESEDDSETLPRLGERLELDLEQFDSCEAAFSPDETLVAVTVYDYEGCEHKRVVGFDVSTLKERFRTETPD